MSHPPKITRVSFVLAVHDLARSTRYWRDVLGFEQLKVDAPGWSFMRRDEVGVNIGECRDAIAPADLGDHSYFAYIVFDDLDTYRDEIAGRGAEVTEPKNEPWGMREARLKTIDSHRIMLAQQLKR
jgi:predicted enzyme related to lactoylglutathione lyase